MALSKNEKNAILRYLRDFAIALVISALVGVTADYVCYLTIGETSAGTWYNKYWMGFFFCCTLIGSSFFVLRDKLGEKPEYLYLIIVLTIGLFMAWSLSVVMVGWDTGIHFKNVLGWADIDDQFELSSSELAFATTSLSQSSGVENVYSLDGLHHLESWLNSNNQDIVDIRPAYSFWKVATAVEYIPCAIVMFFCELANLPFTTSHFLSLAPSVLIYGIVTYFGMRKLQSGKILYATIALFPTAIFLVANYGYQYWNCSLFLYAFACLASFMQRRKTVPAHEIVLMMIAFVLACLPRLSYVPLVLLSLLIPKACFSSKRASCIFRISLVSIFVIGLAMLVIPSASSNLQVGDTRGGSDINPTEQLSLIFADPLGYAWRLLAFFAPPYCISPDTGDFVSGFLTPSGSIRAIGLLGYLGLIPKPAFLLIVLVVTTATITDKTRDTRYGVLPGLCSVLVSFIIIVLTTTYMYACFNNVGEDAFRGMQARYLLPLAFPTLVFLGKGKWGLNGTVIPSSVYNGTALALISIVLMASWWELYVGQIY